jgi:hypothetical protein
VTGSRTCMRPPWVLIAVDVDLAEAIDRRQYAFTT